MALPSEQEVIENGLNAVRAALKAMHPRLKAGDPNRTQYDDASHLPLGRYVGVIEKRRIYCNRNDQTGTALVVSLRGSFTHRGEFLPQYIGSYEIYYSHASTFSWNRLVDLYLGLGLTTTDENGIEHPLETADQIVDVDPVGCVFECRVLETKDKKRHFIGDVKAATKDYPVFDVTEPGTADASDAPTPVPPAPANESSASLPTQEELQNGKPPF